MEAMDPLVGRLIAGKLRLLELLGSGACGKVFRARHEGLDKTVAIKVLHRMEIGGANLARRFKAEARAASRLDHPNSMRILDFGEDGPDGLLYIAMELLDGEDLGTVMERAGSLEPARIADIMSQVLAALAVAHQQGVVHRDMKPGNIMLLPLPDDHGLLRDVVKVCDFGLAKLLDGDLTDGTGAPLTKQGAILGTPLYMSPEQASGEPTDGLTDIYACGVIMYQMLTGRVPFMGQSATAILIKHISEAPVPILSLVPTADPGLAAIATRAMAKRKEERFPSAREMLLAIREVQRALPNPAGPALSRSAAMRAAHPKVETAASGTDGAFAPTYVRGALPDASPGEVPRTFSGVAPPTSAGESLAPRRARSWMILSVVLGSLMLFIAGGGVAFVVLRNQDVRVEKAPIAGPISTPKEAPKAPSRAESPTPEPRGPVVTTTPDDARASEARPRPHGDRRAGAGEARDPRPGDPRPDPKRPPEKQPSGEARAPADQPSSGERTPSGEPPVVQQPQEKPPVEKGADEPVAEKTPEPPKASPVPAKLTLEAKISGLSLLGGGSKTRAQDALAHALEKLNQCLSDVYLPKGAAARGAIKVSARIDQTGRLADITSEGEGGGADKCIYDALTRGTRFEKPDTGDARISFRLEFEVR